MPVPLIEIHGAVSEQVAAAMANGALARPRRIAVSVTGVPVLRGSADKRRAWFGSGSSHRRPVITDGCSEIAQSGRDG